MEIKIPSKERILIILFLALFASIFVGFSLFIPQILVSIVQYLTKEFLYNFSFLFFALYSLFPNLYIRHQRILSDFQFYFLNVIYTGEGFPILPLCYAFLQLLIPISFRFSQFYFNVSFFPSNFPFPTIHQKKHTLFSVCIFAHLYFIFFYLSHILSYCFLLFFPTLI
jgi:hypothetical protein